MVAMFVALRPAQQRPAAAGRRAGRGVDRDPRPRPGDAPADDVRRDGLRLARRLPADPRAHPRGRAVDGRGGRQPRAAVGRDARPGRRLGVRAGPPPRGRGRPRALRRAGPRGGRRPAVGRRGCPAGTSRSAAAAASGGGSSGGMFSSSAVPDFGAMTAALATIGVAASSGSGSSGERRLQRRQLGWRWRGRRRRLLRPLRRTGGRTPDSLDSGHGCCRDDGGLLRAAEHRRPAGAVKLFDERAEMRVHVQGSSQTAAAASEQVGGWFLRADNGLRMIPGDVRETGNTYEADLVVIRPGRSQPAPGRDLPRRSGPHHRHQPRAPLVVESVVPERCRPDAAPRSSAS